MDLLGHRGGGGRWRRLKAPLCSVWRASIGLNGSVMSSAYISNANSSMKTVYLYKSARFLMAELTIQLSFHNMVMIMVLSFFVLAKRHWQTCLK